MRAARKLRNQANQVCPATNLQKYFCYRFLLRSDGTRTQAILQWIHENAQKPPYNGDSNKHSAVDEGQEEMTE